MPRPESGRRRRGVALVLALVVLAVLSLLGTPFVASMLLRRKQSTRASAVARLRNAAVELRNRARSHLRGTHEDSEAREFDRKYPPARRPEPGPLSAFSSGRRRSSGDRVPPVRPQDVDGTEEIAAINLIFKEEAEHGLRVLAEGSLSDEQGKVDVNTASFLLLGNVLGSSHLAEDIDAEETALPLVDASVFRVDGDPRTPDGLLVIYDASSGTFEAVTYRSRAGKELRGVHRGELLTLPKAHRKGALVMDARALKIFLHRFQTGKEFAAVGGLRRINDWPLMRFFASQLWRYGLSVKELPRSKLLSRVLGAVEAGKVDTEKLLEAERKLVDAGFPADLIDDIERISSRVRAWLYRRTSSISPGN